MGVEFRENGSWRGQLGVEIEKGRRVIASGQRWRREERHGEEKGGVAEATAIGAVNSEVVVQWRVRGEGNED